MGLTAPLWLLGLTALLLPLLLHLLARGRGRRVRVGSVLLLTAATPRRPRRLQLQRPLLLLLRCLLLAAVVLALAAPRVRRPPADGARTGAWVLLEPALAVRAARDPTLWRALPAAPRLGIAGGAEVRLLAPGLPLRAAIADPALLPDPAAVAGGLWSLLREAAAKAPAGTPLMVISEGRLAALRGERPALARPVSWYELSDRRGNRWVAGAMAAANGPQALIGESDATAARFRPGIGPVSGAAVRLPAGDAVAADDALRLAPVRPLRVALLAAPDRGADAAYLRAALGVAAEVAGQPLQWQLDTGGPAAAAVAAGAGAGAGGESLRDAAPRLVFWLADAPPPPPLLAAVRTGGLLVTDASRPEETCGGAFVAAPTTAPVGLRRCVAGDGGESGREAAAVLWAADTGRPLLLARPLGSGRLLSFRGRFHPTWSELVLSPAFPAWLGELLRASAGGRASAERATSDRRLAAGQGAPAREPAVASARARSPRLASRSPASRLPEHLLWLLLAPLLLVDRWVARR
ncbi:MAG TPA: BatA domain-containing protein [Thermoanaerobaculia bacterium]|jgi:hypothetical protein|nr:BatA domain-containing protein [Thermoanaerobaculia bacterium]